jgi:hypothetical protein
MTTPLSQDDSPAVIGYRDDSNQTSHVVEENANASTH